MCLTELGAEALLDILEHGLAKLARDLGVPSLAECLAEKGVDAAAFDAGRADLSASEKLTAAKGLLAAMRKRGRPERGCLRRLPIRDCRAAPRWRSTS